MQYHLYLKNWKGKESYFERIIKLLLIKYKTSTKINKGKLNRTDNPEIWINNCKNVLNDKGETSNQWQKKIQTSGQEGGAGRHDSPLHTTTSEIQQNTEQPSLRTVRIWVQWKSDNYRIRETTSTHTGRKGADAQNRLVSHPCVVDKNSGGISQEQGVPAPH